MHSRRSRPSPSLSAAEMRGNVCVCEDLSIGRGRGVGNRKCVSGGDYYSLMMVGDETVQEMDKTVVKV